MEVVGQSSVVIKYNDENKVLIIPLSNIDEITLEKVNGHKKIRIDKKGSPTFITFLDTDVSCHLFNLLL